MVWRVRDARLRRSDGAADSRWTQESDGFRIHQSAQVRRRHRNDAYDIPRPKVPLILRPTDCLQ